MPWHMYGTIVAQVVIGVLLALALAVVASLASTFRRTRSKRAEDTDA